MLQAACSWTKNRKGLIRLFVLLHIPFQLLFMGHNGGMMIMISLPRYLYNQWVARWGEPKTIQSSPGNRSISVSHIFISLFLLFPPSSSLNDIRTLSIDSQRFLHHIARVCQLVLHPTEAFICSRQIFWVTEIPISNYMRPQVLFTICSILFSCILCFNHKW